MLLLALLALFSASAYSGDEVSLTTKRGTFSGRVVRQSVLYPNIAYAQPPVGRLRWRRSLLEDKARQAKERVQCPQIFPDYTPEDKPPNGWNEDCLYMNVWTPASDGKKRPVVFLIHGGGLLTGNGLKDFYDGSVFARQGNVFVSFNYRLAELGFGPSLEKVPGSLGLMDQGLALDWVVKNIAEFGGDPENIFLIGHSKGAEAITALAQSGMAGPEVKGGIALSGPRNFPLLVRPDLATFWKGEQNLDAMSILRKKGSLLYVPDLPHYRDPSSSDRPFRLLASNIYDERFEGSPMSLYCSNIHFLEQYPPYIHAYFYVWHPYSGAHGAELTSLFREDKFGKEMMRHIQSFIHEGAPPSIFGKVPSRWSEKKQAIHVYPEFSFTHGIDVPPNSSPEKFAQLHAACEKPMANGSTINAWYQRAENFLGFLHNLNLR